MNRATSCIFMGHFYASPSLAPPYRDGRLRRGTDGRTTEEHCEIDKLSRRRALTPPLSWHTDSEYVSFLKSRGGIFLLGDVSWKCHNFTLIRQKHPKSSLIGIIITTPILNGPFLTCGYVISVYGAGFLDVAQVCKEMDKCVLEIYDAFGQLVLHGLLTCKSYNGTVL